MLHGINHNMFGKRDLSQYGTVTLNEINASLVTLGKELGADIEHFQTNSEGDMCDRIQVDKYSRCADHHAAPGAYRWSGR